MKFSKLSFNQIHVLFQALQYAFMNEGPNHNPDDDIDPRFHASWSNLLLLSGWTEDNFFEELDEMEEHECENCAAEREAEELPPIDDSGKKDDAKSKAN